MLRGQNQQSRKKKKKNKKTGNTARKGNNKYTHGEEKHKTLFTDDITFYVENLKGLTKNS